jgi:hypothetical protein
LALEEEIGAGQLMVKGPLPIALTVAVPVQPPLHAIEFDVTVMVGPVGSLSVVTSVEVHPAASFTMRE